MTHPEIKPAWVSREHGQTLLYADQRRTILLRKWEDCRPSRPTASQRYHHEGRQCYKLHHTR